MATPNLQTSTVFLRDGFVPFAQANLSIAASPVLYGLGIYTVFGVCWNEEQKKLYAFRLRDHYDRLVNSARIMDFQQFIDEWSYERFEKTMLELLRRNKVKSDALVRVGVFIDEIMGGTKMHGLKNSVSAFVYPFKPLYTKPSISVGVSSWQRTPDNAIPSRAKVNGSYVNASLMKNEALLNGYDDAVALDSHGHVTESTVANIFVVRDGILISPDGATDLLEGITRNTIFTLADKLQIPHTKRSLDRSELYLADEIFLCGSSAIITPVTAVDKRPVGSGKIGPLTKQLMKSYQAAQRGTDDSFPEWRLAL